MEEEVRHLKILEETKELIKCIKKNIVLDTILMWIGKWFICLGGILFMSEIQRKSHSFLLPALVLIMGAIQDINRSREIYMAKQDLKFIQSVCDEYEQKLNK